MQGEAGGRRDNTGNLAGWRGHSTGGYPEENYPGDWDRRNAYGARWGRDRGYGREFDETHPEGSTQAARPPLPDRGTHPVHASVSATPPHPVDRKVSSGARRSFLHARPKPGAYAEYRYMEEENVPGSSSGNVSPGHTGNHDEAAGKRKAGTRKTPGSSRPNRTHKR